MLKSVQCNTSKRYLLYVPPVDWESRLWNLRRNPLRCLHLHCCVHTTHLWSPGISVWTTLLCVPSSSTPPRGRAKEGRMQAQILGRVLAYFRGKFLLLSARLEGQCKSDPCRMSSRHWQSQSYKASKAGHAESTAPKNPVVEMSILWFVTPKMVSFSTSKWFWMLLWQQFFLILIFMLITFIPAMSGNSIPSRFTLWSRHNNFHIHQGIYIE